ncbi:MAG: hypothetical protein NTY00_03495 [Deltaproteobacteria bacterium]|nr:hypothetical protein [Deltaproteobacteria bacterium]
MEIKAKREKRRDALIINFVDGFALGWKMAVPESFKEALDIKLTARILAGKREMLWTKGLIYNFHEGDTLYDTKLAYKEWGEALKHLKLCVQVQSVSSSGYVTDETKTNDGLVVKKQRLKYGSLIFKVYRPNEEKTAVKECEVIECTQDDFVAFLQTGIIRTKENKQLNLCGENA